MATNATDATAQDAEPTQAYFMIERDTVPAPAPQPDASLQDRTTELNKWLQPTDFISPGNELMKHVRSYVPGSGKSVFAATTVCQLQEAGHIVLFFFRQIVDKNHTARYLVRDFAAQLLPHFPALVTALTALSQNHGVGGNELGLV
ncbi:hypothetical protein N0V88_007452 [Collariella sp. IMI 366227]|nr:hypothetical protein N0V88_007452 [Collariella sp. IMI 366227]